MVHEPRLLDFLVAKAPERFDGIVYRATRLGLAATTPSTAGGRWMPRDGMAVLYTSTEWDGALAEMRFHLGLLSPVPRKPIAVHRLQVAAKRMIRITRNDFDALDIDPNRFGELDYRRPEIVGDAIGFLEFDAMLVPSARWPCENLVLLQDNQDLSDSPTVLDSEEVAWIDWAKSPGSVGP